MPSRRALLLGAAGLVGTGAVVAATDVLPPRVRSRLGLLDELDVEAPDIQAGPIEVGRLRSGATHRTAYPPGAGPGTALPVCLVLHGRGGTSADAFGGHALDRYLAQVVGEGVPPFVLAAVDGGDAYWHPRKDGRDPVADVDELLTVLGGRGHPVDRVALTGWSMGGYGALALGAQWGRDRVAGVVADSAALFASFSDARPGAFDDEADFRANDLQRRLAPLRALRLRLACGRDDPFAPAVRRLAAQLPDVEVDIGPGSHTEDYWRSVAAEGLRFAGTSLSR